MTAWAMETRSGDSPERDSGIWLQSGLGFQKRILQQVETDPVIAAMKAWESPWRDSSGCLDFSRPSIGRDRRFLPAQRIVDLIVDLPLEGMSGIELS